MKVYFQYGEFYDSGTDWTSIIIQIIGFLVTIYAAYYGSKVAFSKQSERDEKNKNEELKNRYQYLSIQSYRAFKATESQLGYFKEYIENLKENPSNTFDYKRTSMDDLQRLIQLLNEEKTFQSYIKYNHDAKNSHSNYNLLITLSDYYFNSTENMISNIINTSKEIHLLRDEFSKKYYSFEKNILQTILQKPYNTQQPAENIKNIIRNPFPEKDIEDLTFVNNKIIKPIYFNLENFNPKIDEFALMNEFKELQILLDQIIKLNLTYSSNFELALKPGFEKLENYKSLINQIEQIN